MVHIRSWDYDLLACDHGAHPLDERGRYVCPSVVLPTVIDFDRIQGERPLCARLTCLRLPCRFLPPSRRTLTFWLSLLARVTQLQIELCSRQRCWRLVPQWSENRGVCSPVQLPKVVSILWSHSLNIPIASHTFKMPQHNVGNHLGLHIAAASSTSPCLAYRTTGS